MVSGKSRICGIIGDPIEHTISPVMQNAAFKELDLDYIYVPFKVKAEDLGTAIQGMRALGIRGLNVTIPHKVASIQHLDEIDGLAHNIGAVNTIVNTDGVLKGFNTDASGFLCALAAENVKPEGKNIIIIGAGGAARAIAFILADKNANLTIINRHLDKAEDISGRIISLFRREVKALELNTVNLETALSEVDMLINTTNLGMTPAINETPIPARLLKPGLVVVDIIYNPLQTRLLNEAREQGAKVISGIEMLVWQGAAAFELWTGKEAPVEIMKKALVSALRQYEN